MTDRDVLVDWIARFMWEWEGSGVLYGDAANALLDVVESRLVSNQGALSPLPDAGGLLRALENLPD